MVDSFNFSNHDILMGFLLGVPQLTFGFICITIGSRSTPSTTIGLLMLTETIFGPIWVWLVIKEQPSIETLYGGAIIIITISIHSFLKLKNS